MSFCILFPFNPICKHTNYFLNSGNGQMHPKLPTLNSKVLFSNFFPEATYNFIKYVFPNIEQITFCQMFWCYILLTFNTHFPTASNISVCFCQSNLYCYMINPRFWEITKISSLLWIKTIESSTGIVLVYFFLEVTTPFMFHWWKLGLWPKRTSSRQGGPGPNIPQRRREP